MHMEILTGPVTVSQGNQHQGGDFDKRTRCKDVVLNTANDRNKFRGSRIVRNNESRDTDCWDHQYNAGFWHYDDRKGVE